MTGLKILSLSIIKTLMWDTGNKIQEVQIFSIQLPLMFCFKSRFSILKTTYLMQENQYDSN